MKTTPPSSSLILEIYTGYRNFGNFYFKIEDFYIQSEQC